MRFSVIMPCRLEPYGCSARYPDLKLRRAVDSVLDQTFKDLELIVIADGCEQTKKIVKEYKDKRIRLFEVTHKVPFDNKPRNKGLSEAKGEYIIYCDADDYWGKEHLEIIDRNIGDNNWVWFNDIAWDKRNEQWIERACNVRRMGSVGTSNICHAAALGLRWDRPGYAHDYHFTRKLLIIKKQAKIETPQYFVCHIPGESGYDL